MGRLKLEDLKKFFKPHKSEKLRKKNEKEEQVNQEKLERTKTSVARDSQLAGNEAVA